MQIHNVIQGTEDWLQLRVGKITGTRLKSVVGSNKVRETLLHELLAEELTGVQEEIYVNGAMRWGVEHEDEAVEVYEKKYKVKTEKVGFCVSDEFDFLGLSPDRLIKKRGKYVGAVEVKAPTSKTVIKYLLDGGVPADYRWQVVNYFLVCETLKELDFIIYDPRIHRPALRLTKIHVTRKEVEGDIEKARNALITFRQEWLLLRDKLKC